MRSTVTLTAVAGPHQGREFVFDRHDIFVFGRAAECHCAVTDDHYLSSNHFLLEVNPPDCELRDLGSKNGTTLNGADCGRRGRGEAPQAAAARAQAAAVRHGDVIGAGVSRFAVKVRRWSDCPACGKEFELPAGAAQGDEPERCPDCVKSRAGAEPAPPRRAPAKAGRGLFSEFWAGLGALGTAEAAPEFPGHRVEKALASGGMGRVYLARRLADGRREVVKVIKPRRGRVTERQAQVFRREMSVTMSLKHPNIVEFFDQGESQGVFFFTMEYCDGGSARDLMAASGGRLGLERAADIVIQSLVGLEFAHGRDVVHRDLKPDNLLLSGSGVGMVAKIGDFGLAKHFTLAGLSGMTASGYRGGTLQFMPKEQLRDFRAAKPVSDVFAMGATLYNMLSGEMIYDQSRAGDLCSAILGDKLVPIGKRGLDLPQAVKDVMDQATAPDCRERYQTAREFKEALIGASRA